MSHEAAAERSRRLATAVAAAVFLAVLGAAGAVLPGLALDTDITRFLPPSGDPRVDGVLRRLAGSELNRMVILTVRAPGSARETHGAVDTLVSALEKAPEVA